MSVLAPFRHKHLAAGLYVLCAALWPGLNTRPGGEGQGPEEGGSLPEVYVNSLASVLVPSARWALRPPGGWWVFG